MSVQWGGVVKRIDSWSKAKIYFEFVPLEAKMEFILYPHRWIINHSNIIQVLIGLVSP